MCTYSLSGYSCDSQHMTTIASSQALVWGPAQQPGNEAIDDVASATEMVI